jgi:threonine dehydratase
VFCKLEYLQRTGSFKERGARNALLLLDAQQRESGVITASAGNHALGLAYHGQLLSIPVTVVMPKHAPLIKVATCRELGANVILHGESYGESLAHAQTLAAQSALRFIHGFNDEAIIAGQGTLGLEILVQIPDVEAIVVPVGGGGLIAGVALAVKSQRPDVMIVGVEALHTPNFAPSLAAGHPVAYAPRPTLADGLAVGKAGEIPFGIARSRIDRLVQVSEDELCTAVLRLIELEKSVVEGAGAAPLAACLSGRAPELIRKRVALVLCGGNIDPTMLSRVIEHGLVADGRLCRFTATISDRPGGLARLAQAIAATGASVKQIEHDRAFSGSDLTAVNVLCTVETFGRAHIDELFAQLQKSGISIVSR